MNKVILIGRMTTDPVLRKTRTGSDFLYVTLAVGGKETSFIPVKAFGATAKLISEWGHKGKQIAVCGHIVMVKGESDKYSKMEVAVEVLDFLSPKNDGVGGGDGYEQTRQDVDDDEGSGEGQGEKEDAFDPFADD